MPKAGPPVAGSKSLEASVHLVISCVLYRGLMLNWLVCMSRSSMLLALRTEIVASMAPAAMRTVGPPDSSARPDTVENPAATRSHRM